MPTETITPTPEQMTEARGHLADCFEDLPDDLTDAEVIAGIRRHVVGGWDGFVDLIA